MLDIRPSPIAGTWYEADPAVLARIVDGYLDDAQLPQLDGEVMAVIAPHAGHQYSGAVAGYAFAALRGASTLRHAQDGAALLWSRYDGGKSSPSTRPAVAPLSGSPKLVAVIAPMHHPYSQPLITSAHDAYSTPLGDVLIDKDTVGELDEVLKSDLGFGLSPVSNDPEHSLEIELPFLQRALKPGWKLLPVMVRAQEPRVSEGLGKALAKVLANKNFSLVASTDLSHFYNQKTALNYDRAMLDQIEAFSPEGAFDLERARKGFACGLGAFAAVLWASRQLGADKVKVLRHATSGDVTGDYSSVVGYGAAVILKEN